MAGSTREYVGHPIRGCRESKKYCQGRAWSWSRCLVRHTSAESELLQVEQAANDNTTSKQMIFFIAGTSRDRRLMVSDLYMTFQIENVASLQLRGAAHSKKVGKCGFAAIGGIDAHILVALTADGKERTLGQ
jgi:hypothetical protein